MSENTPIEWAHHTFNPWWGCVKVDDGCTHCYAEALARRLGRAQWGCRARRVFQSDAYWDKPRRWHDRLDKIPPERRPVWRVFCGSMCDVFEELHDDHFDRRPMEAARARLWRLIEATPHLRWLLLTKRPENHEMVPLAWQTGSRRPINVSLGISAHDQNALMERAPYLCRATWPLVRFVSYEPALGPLDITPSMLTVWECPHCGGRNLVGDLAGELATGRCESCRRQPEQKPFRCSRGVGWVIAGSESGPGARPMDEDWIRSLRDNCGAYGIPFFYKQRLEGRKKITTPRLDGVRHVAVPETLGAPDWQPTERDNTTWRKHENGGERATSRRREATSKTSSRSRKR